MKRLTIVLMVACLIITSCNKNKCITCDEPPVHIDYYFPYSTNMDTLIEYTNLSNDTLKASVHKSESNTSFRYKLGSVCGANRVLHFKCITINSKPRATLPTFEVMLLLSQDIDIEKYTSKLYSYYDCYRLIWRTNGHDDINLKKYDIDFRNGEELPIRIEVGSPSGITPVFCNRFIIEQNKGLVEFDDVINNCTWKLVE